MVSGELVARPDAARAPRRGHADLVLGEQDPPRLGDTNGVRKEIEVGGR
jgi:hypothetical protein